MGASFNQFRNHIYGPISRDMVNISWREQFIQKLLQYSTTVLSLKLVLPLNFASLEFKV
jgi:hypothetical protein